VRQRQVVWLRGSDFASVAVEVDEHALAEWSLQSAGRCASVTNDQSDERVARRLELAIRLVALIWVALGAPGFAVAAIACGRPSFALGSVAAARVLAVAKLVPPAQ
jgi:hypothetical protein